MAARTIRTDRNTVIRPLSQGIDLRALHRVCPARYPYLLQSTAAQTHLGRYDILFAFPRAELVLERSGQLGGHCSDDASRFLQALDDWWREERQPRNSSRLPFQGGWFLYLGYELAAEVEPALDLESDEVLPFFADHRRHYWNHSRRQGAEPWRPGDSPTHRNRPRKRHVRGPPPPPIIPLGLQCQPRPNGVCLLLGRNSIGVQA